MTPHFSSRWFHLSGFALLLTTLFVTTAAQSATELKPKTPLQVEIKPGEVHSYTLVLSSG